MPSFYAERWITAANPEGKQSDGSPYRCCHQKDNAFVFS